MLISAVQQSDSVIHSHTQMDLSTKQKQTHRHREQICGCHGGGEREGWSGSLGLADANDYIEWISNKVLLVV